MGTKDNKHSQSPNPELGHEQDVIDAGAIVKFGVGLVVIAVVLYVICAGLYKLLEMREEAANAAPYPLYSQKAKLPPVPRLQGDPISDLHHYREAEQKSLGFEVKPEEKIFVNSQFVHGEGVTPLPEVKYEPKKAVIPIEDAMKKVLQQGFPVRANSTSTEKGYQDEAEKMPEDSSSGRTLERRLR